MFMIRNISTNVKEFFITKLMTDTKRVILRDDRETLLFDRETLLYKYNKYNYNIFIIDVCK